MAKKKRAITPKKPTFKQMAKRANELHEEVLRQARTTLETARECGRVLQECKLLAGHGNWGPWVKDNFIGSHETANLYMRIDAEWETHIKPRLDKGENMGVAAANELIAAVRKTKLPVAPDSCREADLVTALPAAFKKYYQYWPNEALAVFYDRFDDIMDSIAYAIQRELGVIERPEDPPKYLLLEHRPPEEDADNTPDLTPVEKHGDIWLKRDDLFQINGIRGGKVRACWKMAQGAEGLVTAGHRQSPQVAIVARVAARLGVPCRCHTAQGVFSRQMKDAVANGAQVIQHRAGYSNVLSSRAKDDAEERGWTLIPFGMEDERVVELNAAQTENIPRKAKRIVITLGSGMSAAGLLHGLRRQRLKIPVLGVRIGKDPTKILDKHAPENWREMMNVVTSELKYERPVYTTIDDVKLDPIYEAKAKPYLQPGDLFWIVGVRRLG